MARTKVTVKSPDFGKWQKAVNDLVKEVGFAVEQEAIANAPRSEGEANSNHYMDNIKYNHTTREVVAGMSYSADIEYGTGAHVIEPVTAKALHFKKGGNEIFAKKVNHPGTRPNPVMRNAAAKVQKEINQIWQEVQKENGL